MVYLSFISTLLTALGKAQRQLIYDFKKWMAGTHTTEDTDMDMELSSAGIAKPSRTLL